MSYDQFIGALCLWREARNCTPDVIRAIWHVLLNRVADPARRWPPTIHQAVLQPKQFSSFNMVLDGSGQGLYRCDPNAVKFPSRANPVEWKVFETCMDIVSSSLDEDPTKGANHYEDCRQDQLPGWADPIKQTADIGPFRFYRL